MRVLKSNEGFISILLTIIITALLVGGGVYYYQKRFFDNSIKEAVKNVSDQTTLEIDQLKSQIEELEKEAEKKNIDIDEPAIIGLDWQKYTNSQYGFSLKTPLNWPVDYGVLDIDGMSGNKVYISGTTNSIAGSQAHIIITPLLLGETEIQAFARLQDMDISLLTSKYLNLGSLGVTAYYDIESSQKISVVTFVKDGNLYAAYDLKPQDREVGANVFLAIIGSIKFDDDLQTYKNDEYKYIVKIPNTWVAYSEYDGSTYDLKDNLGPSLGIGDAENLYSEVVIWAHDSPKVNSPEEVIDFYYKDSIVNTYVSPDGLEGKVLTGFKFADDLKLSKTSLKKVYIFENNNITYSLAVINDVATVKSVIDSFKFLD